MNVLIAAAFLIGADPLPPAQTWTVDGVKRSALVFRATQITKQSPPLVFVFHGHGGTMKNAAEKFAVHTHWPEAVVVYMQGLPTPGKTDPDGKRPGWQKTVGDQNDRDLKFFDVVYDSFKKGNEIDLTRVYAMGHSNGGGFTYLLWAARGDRFAAFAPSAAGGGRLLRDATPKPVMHLAGEKDNVVPFENQQATIGMVKKLNGCDEKGKTWGKHATEYHSSKGARVVTYIHAGDHKFPEAAVPEIVRFFKEHWIR